MIQAFYTASSGMNAQQKNMDVISNNIANVNTPGYRIQRGEFRELFDQAMTQIQPDSSYGYGVKMVGTTTMPLPNDINPLKMSILGSGYFVVADAEGNQFYTTDGIFKIINEDNQFYLATEDNEYVLDENFNRVQMGPSAEEAFVANDLLYPQGSNGDGVKLAVVQFENVSGLRPIKPNYVEETQLSGEPTLHNGATIHSNYHEELAALALDNQIADITRIMQAQMAYSFNSRALQIADEMEGMVNHLRY